MLDNLIKFKIKMIMKYETKCINIFLKNNMIYALFLNVIIYKYKFKNKL